MFSVVRLNSLFLDLKLLLATQNGLKEKFMAQIVAIGGFCASCFGEVGGEDLTGKEGRFYLLVQGLVHVFITDAEVAITRGQFEKLLFNEIIKEGAALVGLPFWGDAARGDFAAQRQRTRILLVEGVHSDGAVPNGGSDLWLLRLDLFAGRGNICNL